MVANFLFWYNQANFLFGYKVRTTNIVLVTTKEKQLCTNRIGCQCFGSCLHNPMQNLDFFPEPKVALGKDPLYYTNAYFSTLMFYFKFQFYHVSTLHLGGLCSALPLRTLYHQCSAICTTMYFWQMQLAFLFFPFLAGLLTQTT